MEKYKEYKDSGVKWIGEVPGHWECVSLKRITTFSPKLSCKIDDKTMVGYAPMETVRFDKMTPKSIEYSKLSTGLTYFEEGDVVIAKVTPCFENGNLAVVPPMVHKCGYGSSELFVYRATNHIETRFLLYALRSEKFIAKGASTMTGTGGLKRVSSEFAKNAQIPLPPLSEQRSIVTFLDGKCRKIDLCMERKSKEIELLRELKQAVIAEAVTRGINPNATLKNSNIPWIGEIPEGWEVKRLALLSKLRSTKNCRDKQLLSVFLDRGVIPFSDASEKRTNVTAVDLSNYQLVKCGDFVLNNQQAWRGSVGISNHEGIISPAYIILELSKDFDRTYANYLFRSKVSVKYYEIISRGVGSIQRNLYYPYLKNMLVPLPPLAEQRAIVAHIDTKCAQIDAAIAHLQAEIDHFKAYKQRLISDAVTGQICVLS